MVQGGAVDTGNSKYLAQGIFEIIQENKALQKEAKNFLDKNEDLKNLDPTKKADIISLLKNEESKEFLAAVSKKLSEEDKFRKLAEQVGKNRVMEEKLEALGNQLLAQRLISAAAVTTLTGALAGTLAIGGVAGVLIVGGAALVGFVALVAIAAIGYLIYQNRGEIKKGAIGVGTEVKNLHIEAGKVVTGFVKNIIDKFPTIKAREKNFDKFKNELSVRIMEIFTAQKREGIGEDETQDNLFAMLKVVKMLQNEGQRSAIQDLVKNGTIKNFLEANMTRLLEKGLSTHEEDMQKLRDLMKDFLPAIMAIGNNKIEEVEKIVDKRDEKTEPDSKVDSPSPEQVSEEGKGVS